MEAIQLCIISLPVKSLLYIGLQEFLIHESKQWQKYHILGNFRGWVPFANKFLRMAYQLPLIIIELVFFVKLKFRGCKQICENSEIVLPQKFP